VRNVSRAGCSASNTRTGTCDSRCERHIPPFLTRNGGDGERQGDHRCLLDPGDPPLRTAKLREQTQRKNHAEDQAPSRVQDLVARLVDVAGVTIDQVDQFRS
jgi:hypothetical protein